MALKGASSAGPFPYRNGEIIYVFNAYVVMRIVWVVPYQKCMVTNMVGIVESIIQSVSIV